MPHEMMGETQPITGREGQLRDLTDEEVAVLDGELQTGTELGDWRIERRIGQGGMGTVYAAVHRMIGKRAAIKVVRGELCRSPLTAERFLQEARVVNQIGHPNIVDIFHIGRLDDGRPYLVMELLRGHTLADHLFEGRMSPREAIDVLLQTVAAVMAAHDHGVLHRDLKPDNIFLADGAGGRTVVKIVDWGIAKLVDTMPVAVGMTTTGVMLGTPQYVSPEQARGKKLDARTDIYSLGAIAYEMFLESPPFVADNVADVIAMHLREAPPTPSDVWPDVPASLERLMLAMLEKDPDIRPSLTEVALTLELVRDDLQARVAPVTRRRMAVGSLPPHASPLTGALDVPMVARASASATPSHLMIQPDLSGDMPKIAEPYEDEPANDPPRAARWPWAVAAALVGAAVIAAIVVLAGGRAAPAAIQASEPRHAAAPATKTPAPAPAATAPAATAPASAPVTAPTLDVRVTPPAAHVTVDGAAAELAGGRLVRPVTAGGHTVHVEAAGFAPYDRAIEVSGTVVLDVVLARAATPAKRTAPGAKAAQTTQATQATQSTQTAPAASEPAAAQTSPAPTPPTTTPPPTPPTQPTPPKPIDPNATIEPFP
jgi:serine/threonine-protein kinase